MLCACVVVVGGGLMVSQIAVQVADQPLLSALDKTSQRWRGRERESWLLSGTYFRGGFMN